MSERRFIALCFTLGVLCILVGASAARSATRPDSARLAWFLPVARAAWPASPCVGREVIYLNADALLEQVASSGELGAAAQARGLDGMAAPAACMVWMHSGLDDDRFCTVLVHELGHLSGRGHTTIPGDVMNGDGDISWKPCDDAVLAGPPPPRAPSHRATHRLCPLRPWGLRCTRHRR